MEAGERTLEIVKYSDRILEALEVTDAGSDDAREDMALGPEESVHVDLLSGCGVVVVWCGVVWVAVVGWWCVVLWCVVRCGWWRVVRGSANATTWQPTRSSKLAKDATHANRGHADAEACADFQENQNSKQEKKKQTVQWLSAPQ